MYRKGRATKRVVIVGAGFAGISAVSILNNSDIEVLLFDKSNHHLFQPLLYQVATAALSPGDISAPIRHILRKQKNVTVYMDEVIEIIPEKNKIVTQSRDIDFDYLILCPGSIPNYYGNNHWAKNAIGLKTIRQALQIREKILYSFEQAELTNNEFDNSKYLTFIVIGGGPTGVELAGAIGELANHSLLNEFKNINPSKARIILVEGSDKILASFNKRLSDCALKCLNDLGVEVQLNALVQEVEKDYLRINGKKVFSNNILWAAGNKSTKVLDSLKYDKDKSGRIIVDDNCSIPSFKNIFVIGDAANFKHNDIALPQVAPVAIQQGKFVSESILNDIYDRPRKKFKYKDKGQLATIGRGRAIAQFRKRKFSGFFAWIIWVFVHILSLINYRNKIKVLTEWIWLYTFYNNSIRLITKPHSRNF